MKLTPKQQQRLHEAFNLHEAGELQAAADIYRSLLRAQPASTVLLSNLGVVFLQLGKRAEALPLLERSLKIEPRQPEVLAACGMAYVEEGRPDAALAMCAKATQYDPQNFAAFHAAGLAHHLQQNYQAALDSFEETLKLAPGHIEAYCNRGLSQLGLGDAESAIASFRSALEHAPYYMPAQVNLLRTLRRIRKIKDGLIECQRFLALTPSEYELQYEYAALLDADRQREQALTQYQKLVMQRPDDLDAWRNLAGVAKHLKKHDLVLEAARMAYRLAPNGPFVRSDLLGAALELCSWEDYFSLLSDIPEPDLLLGAALRPFETLRLPISPTYQLSAAKKWIEMELAGAPSARQFAPTPKDRDVKRLRVGVVTSDLRDHPVAYLLENFFPQLSRECIQLIGLPTLTGSIPAHREEMFDEWHELALLTGAEAIEKMLVLDLHIVLNLNGITAGERSELFATRIAPIQVSFLGYAGTLGADYFDYLIADKYVVPEASQAFYTEKLAYMPDSFFVPNIAEISEQVMTREEEGLPEDCVVFCCFNNSYKITPDIFDVWMRLLTQVPDSVLWLSRANALVEKNLRKEALARGVDDSRLVFARFREPRAEHLRRLQLADLFLDTFYYNAHTTASDALWAGVPVLTCPGETFASRVAGSLLKAASMEELIAEDRSVYESMALRLAQDRNYLAEVRAKLQRNRETQPIFDMPRYARNFERLLLAMWNRHEQGLPPAPIELVAE